MANRLATDKTQGIMQLVPTGKSERQIVRSLISIDSRSIAAYAYRGQKGGNLLIPGILPE
jgi:hypothetical protein